VASDAKALRTAVEALLRAAGRDVDKDPDLARTPERVAEVWQREFLAGYDMDPARILASRCWARLTLTWSWWAACVFMPCVPTIFCPIEGSRM